VKWKRKTHTPKKNTMTQFNTKIHVKLPEVWFLPLHIADFVLFLERQIDTQEENTGISSSYTFVSKPGNHNKSYDLSHGAGFHTYKPICHTHLLNKSDSFTMLYPVISP
jgi:hypothetical protein